MASFIVRTVDILPSAFDTKYIIGQIVDGYIDWIVSNLGYIAPRKQIFTMYDRTLRLDFTLYGEADVMAFKLRWDTEGDIDEAVNDCS